jgi:hypothetical protein
MSGTMTVVSAATQAFPVNWSSVYGCRPFSGNTVSK